ASTTPDSTGRPSAKLPKPETPVAISTAVTPSTTRSVHEITPAPETVWAPDAVSIVTVRPSPRATTCAVAGSPEPARVSTTTAKGGTLARPPTADDVSVPSTSATPEPGAARADQRPWARPSPSVTPSSPGSTTTASPRTTTRAFPVVYRIPVRCPASEVLMVASLLLPCSCPAPATPPCQASGSNRTDPHRHQSRGIVSSSANPPRGRVLDPAVSCATPVASTTITVMLSRPP